MALNINILTKRLNQYERTKVGCTKIDRTKTGFLLVRCLLFLKSLTVDPVLLLELLHAIFRTSLSSMNNTG